MILYASTKDLRHSLVHRQIIVDPQDGAMKPASAAGQPTMTALTADEQAAFCRLSGSTVNAVIAGTLSGRQAGQLRWNLDVLGARHGQPPFGAAPASALVPVVVVRPTVSVAGDVTLNFAAIRTEAAKAVGGVSHYDLHIDLPDGRILAGHLEDAPFATTTISLTALPSWLYWS
jgi:hypothetical protein